MPNTIHIIGQSPLLPSLEAFYTQRGTSVVRHTLPLEADIAHESAEGDRCILFSRDDHEALRTLALLAAQMHRLLAAPDDGSEGLIAPRKLPVRLVLRDAVTLQAIRLADFPPEVNAQLDVEVFTLEEMWAQRVLCPMPGAAGDADAATDEAADRYPPLDRRPIGPDSSDRVHLVVIGTGATAEALVRMASLVAHYPNYVRNPQLRTRITWVGCGMDNVGASFRHRHFQLFARSHWRTVSLAGPLPVVTAEHRPDDCPSLTDEFVDVEWEFADGPATHPALQQKLALWATLPDRLLTIALCDAGDTANASLAMGLPEEVGANGCTVLVEQTDDSLIGTLRTAARWQHIHAFGMLRSAYNPLLPRHRLARLLNAFYSASYSASPFTLDEAEVGRLWQQVPSAALRDSNLCAVLTFRTKMRSLGHDESQPHTFYALSADEARLLSEVEHNRWSVERLMAGFRPPTPSERDDIRRNIEAHIAARTAGAPAPEADLKRMMKNERRVHYDLCPYARLGVDATGHDVRDYDTDLTACIPILMERWAEMLKR